MKINSANFYVSNTKVDKCPTPDKPEYAFIGRSNVGKSSLINSLCERNGMAKTSSNPGKTTLINHFIINEQWYLVDLPGYGYAKRSKDDRAKWKTMISSYFRERGNLMNTFVLIDSRISPQKIDLEFMYDLGVKEIPFSIVFTKIDKISKTVLQKNYEIYKEKLQESWGVLPPIFFTSSEKDLGRDEILTYIESTNDICGI